LASSDFGHRLALSVGLLGPRLTGNIINGLSTSVNNVWSDVSDLGGVLTQPAAAGALSLVSSSAADTAAGTGARAVRVEGINAAGEALEETVALSGTTPAAGSNYLHINRITCVSFGSGESNAGDITASIGGVAQCRAVTGWGVSQSTIYRVPAGYRMWLGTFFLNALNGTNTTSWRFGVKLPGSGGWIYPAGFFQGDNAMPVEFRPEPFGAVYPAGTVTKWQARVGVAATISVATGMIYTLAKEGDL